VHRSFIFRTKVSRIAVILLMLFICSTLLGQTTNQLAPGAPGEDAHWPNAAKNGFGTSNTIASRVWFTLNNGVMTEAFYPRLDVPNTQTLQLVICSAHRCQTEADDAQHEIRVLDPGSLTFQQINRARDGSFRITKTYTTDPERSSILIQVNVVGDGDVFLYYDPSLSNSGRHDTAWTEGSALLSFDQHYDDHVASALLCSRSFLETTNGFLGTSDGFNQLKRTGALAAKYRRAEDGNVVQLARLGGPGSFTLALGFGDGPKEALAVARLSLRKGFTKANQEYSAGWHAYLSRLPRVERRYQKQFNVSAMVLKALEDKTYRGAMAASPSIPWGGGPDANDATVTGYHAVWSRDLYQVATAFRALGDRASALRALDYLFKVQQKPDGSFPQNSWINGAAIGEGLQMDQVAFPLVLAYQLDRADHTTWLKHIKPAADFIVRKGPVTEQERWEEEGGFSPGTMAAQIAGLVCAAEIAKRNGDRGSADSYLRKADEWVADLERRTVTSSGPHDEGKYYLRITDGKPNTSAVFGINSSDASFDQREIVDASFLELVRLGIKDPYDPIIVNSVKVADEVNRVDTPNGSGWFRYNHDAYGEQLNGGKYDARNGRGRLWTLLTGERGEYEIAKGNHRAAQKHLDAMMAFANDGLMIPEQVWDLQLLVGGSFRPGEGTGSATPLAWSMAQFIRLALNINARRNLETPQVVRRRYARTTK
jgi:glucoamylase